MDIHETPAWKRIEQVFLDAVERSGEERSRYLEQACGGDTALRREVDALLTADTDATSDMTSVVQGYISKMVAEELVGRNVGPWRIVEEIGRGGMGTVYRAVHADGEIHIEVAIKMLTRGVNSRHLLDRFGRERRILAKLEHPNIAHLLDGGTTDEGTPYLVMEYVPGKPLIAYCDERKLPLAARIALFRKVCDAVSCAHRNLVIHRDLKPDNILVTADGVPKLLDFGIAKILEPGPEDSDELTMTAERMGTPAWCSPEQIRGDHVGVATDIYSLGVVLYRLLTGFRPYTADSVTWENASRVICELEPMRASTAVASRPGSAEEAQEIASNRGVAQEALRREIAGDLDNILAVTLRKEPDRRYHSVEQLSDELGRYLEGRAVMAAGDTFLYLARKFVRRHMLGVSVAVVLTTLLCVSTIAALWQARRLSVRIGEDRKLATTFLTGINDEIARLPGSIPAREALLRKSLDYLNGLARDTGQDRETRRSLALAEERFASLLGAVGQSGFGRSVEARKTWEKARAIREDLAREDPSDRAAQYELANSYLTGSYVVGRAASVEEMLVYGRKSLDIAESLNARDPANRDFRLLLAGAYANLGYGLNIQGKSAEATAWFRKAVPIREKLAADAPNDFDALHELANIHYRLGVTEAQADHSEAALPDLEQALQVQTRLSVRSKDDAQIRSDMASSHHFLGVSLGAMGKYDAALKHFHDAIEIREAALAADPRDGRTRALLAGNYSEQSMVLLMSGRKQDALASILRAVSLQRQALAVDAKGVPVRVSLATFEARLAAVYSANRREQEAGESWARAVVLYDQLDREGHLKTADMRKDAEAARAQAARWARK